VDWSTRRRQRVRRISLRGCSGPSLCLYSVTTAEWLGGRGFEHVFQRGRVICVHWLRVCRILRFTHVETLTGFCEQQHGVCVVDYRAGR